MKNTSKVMKAFIAISLSLAMLVVFMPRAQAVGGAVYYSTNPTLYKALHSVAGIGNDPATPGAMITIAEMQGLTGTLDLSNQSITNIDGIQYCSNVTYLYLSNGNNTNKNDITNFPANMSSMTSLIGLYLNNNTNLSNTTTNISAIASIPNLTALEICSTKVTSVAFLSASPKLTTLLWNNISVSVNLSSVTGLSHLTALDVSTDTGINGNINCLSTMTGIVSLGISYDGVSNLTPIQGMPLTWLNIYGDYITDLTPISGKSIGTLYGGMNYLDLTPSSPDRTILDAFGIIDASWLTSNEQHKVTIAYDTASKGTPAKASDTIYYGQSVTLPTVTANIGYTYKGWDTNGDFKKDAAAGATYTLTGVTLPISGDAITFNAVFQATDAVSSDPTTPVIGNKPLYDALIALFPSQLGHDHAGFITSGELETLSGSVDLSNKSLMSIEGLQYCTGITALNLSGNSGLTSISPLDGEGLEEYSLQTLNLSGTGLTALPGDMQMPHLTSLDISGTPITNTGFAGIGSSNLIALTTLTANHCSSLHDISSITNLPSLATLNLEESSLTSFPTDLHVLANLKILDLKGYIPQTTDPLDVPGTPVVLPSNLSGIATLPEFKNANPDSVWLNISNTNITSISFLNGCAGLKMLFWKYQKNDAAHTPATFTTCPSLYYLDLSYDTGLGNSLVASIAAIPNFATAHTNPGTLCISATGVTNVSGLASAAGLRTLFWQQMPSLTPANLASIEGCTQLTTVDLVNDTGLGGSDAGDTTLSHLQKLTNLKQLGLGSCGIGNLSKLSAMTTLTVLTLDYCPITDISPMSSLTNLQSFHAFDSTLNDITALSGLSNLTDVYFYGDYLDPTVGSDDRLILDEIAARPGASVDYSNQRTFGIQYQTSLGTLSRTSDSGLYYQQLVVLPTVSGVPAGKCVAGWDMDGDPSTAEASPGALARCVAPSLPVTTDPTYNLIFTDLSADCQLSGITLSTSSLSPAFSPTTTMYTLHLPASVPSVKITPKVAAPGATYDIDYRSDYSIVAVDYGQSVPSVIMVDNGSNHATYNILVTRDMPDTTTLSSLGSSVGTLSPATFDPYHTSYTLQVAEDVKTVTFTPVMSYPGSKLYIDGAKKATKTISLNNGQTKTVKIKVVGLKNKNKTYTVKVTRAKSTNDNITNLSVTNCTAALLFDAATQNYTMVVKDNKSSVKITVTKVDPNETVYIDGHKATSRTISIQYGSSKKIPIKIVGQAGSAYTKYYYIILDKAPHINSFSGSPVVSGYATVVINSGTPKPVKLTYSLAANGATTAWIEIYPDLINPSIGSIAVSPASGSHTVYWDGKIAGTPLASGTYYLALIVTYTSPNSLADYSAPPKGLTVVVK